MFDGTWRGKQNQEIKLFKSGLGVAHNMTIQQTDKGGLQRHTPWTIMLSGGLCATTGGEQTDLLDSING